MLEALLFRLWEDTINIKDEKLEICPSSAYSTCKMNTALHQKKGSGPWINGLNLDW